MEDNSGKFKTEIMSKISQFISESICMTTSKYIYWHLLLKILKLFSKKLRNSMRI